MEIKRLIERCRQGDEEALGNLYKAYAQQMKGICHHYVCDPQAVDDVVHDAFLIIFTSLDQLRNEDKVVAWMTGIVRNVSIKYMKSLKAMKTVPQEEVEDEVLSVEEETESADSIANIEELMQMVDRLPDGYGKVFRLSVFEGLSHKEIAEQLGIEPHSSSSQLTRAKKMMRKMMKQYWVWLLTILLIPTIWIIKHYRQPDLDIISDKKTGIATNRAEKETVIKKENQPEFANLKKTLNESPIILSAINKTDVILSSDSSSTIFSKQLDVQNIIPDKEQSDTTLIVRPETSSTFQSIKIPDLKNYVLRDNKHSKQKDWNLAFAYNGNVQNDRSRNYDYMTIPDISDGMTRSTKLYTWGEYMEYVIENASNMDSVTALNMHRVALLNIADPKESLSEKTMHERPLTVQLTLNRQFNNRWSLTSGLSYTSMKSTFESGNENTLIRRLQRIHYLGIPLKVNYSLVGNSRWNLYTTVGLQLDIPVSARLTTKYIYGNAFDHIEDSPNIDASIKAPCQWSFNTGIGVQYQIVPHINIFLEPSMNYFIPNGQGIETFRTEHPFDITLPIGIKLSW